MCMLTHEPDVGSVLAANYPLYNCDDINNEGVVSGDPIGSFAYVCGPHDNQLEYDGTGYESCTGMSASRVYVVADNINRTHFLFPDPYRPPFLSF